MASSNELQTLAFVSSEIDESEVKITFANQCIKAQEALANKLKEEIQRRKEICNNKKNENWKLEVEIRNAELEIQNLRLTQRTLKFSNTEMKRDLLLNKENKNTIAERIKIGEKKYEDLWIQCKIRYESMPLVQKLMQDKKKCEMLSNEMNVLESEAQRLEDAIKAKKAVLAEKDKKLVIQLAKFIVHERPATIKAIKEKEAIINDLTKELETSPVPKDADFENTCITMEKNHTVPENVQSADDNWFISNNLMMPKLQLPNIDMDVINVKLDINKVTQHTSPIKRTVSVTELEKNTVKRSKADEKMRDDYISHYFNKTTSSDGGDDNQEYSEVNYSKKKLINILEDIQIDDTETYKLIAKANIDKLQEVNVIAANKNVKENAKSNKVAPLESEDIEEIDLTNSNIQEVIIPPTQFLDLTQDRTNGGIQQEVEVIVHRTMEESSSKDTDLSQSKEGHKKKVSFDVPTIIQSKLETSDVVMVDDVDRNEDTTPNDTMNSQLDLSAVTEDNYMAIKDMILKKHHLDLSPQFIYAKNTILQKRNDNEVVTSKFFESTNEKNTEPDDNVTTGTKTEVSAKVQEMDQCSVSEDTVVKDKNQVENNTVSLNVENAVLSPKENDMERPVAGLLFSHGPQGMPDCLDISMSTTGYEEGDNDFPTCLDSSLLLSPKADLPMPMSSNNSEVGSQDVPNFLSGFRKTGLSFFKQNLTEAKPDNNKQDQENNFNFNFGGDDKKRGGLFSFFR